LATAALHLILSICIDHANDFWFDGDIEVGKRLRPAFQVKWRVYIPLAKLRYYLFESSDQCLGGKLKMTVFTVDYGRFFEARFLGHQLLAVSL